MCYWHRRAVLIELRSGTTRPLLDQYKTTRSIWGCLWQSGYPRRYMHLWCRCSLRPVQSTVVVVQISRSPTKSLFIKQAFCGLEIPHLAASVLQSSAHQCWDSDHNLPPTVGNFVTFSEGRRCWRKLAFINNDCKGQRGITFIDCWPTHLRSSMSYPGSHSLEIQ